MLLYGDARKIIRAEHVSDCRRDGRTEPQAPLDFVPPGGALIDHCIDCLARSMKDLQDIVRQLQRKGVALRAVYQTIDSSMVPGRTFVDTPGVFVEYEITPPCERQLARVAAAKARGPQAAD
jgi:DNA invertase Pin-like site-specific DNA recombinase